MFIRSKSIWRNYTKTGIRYKIPYQNRVVDEDSYRKYFLESGRLRKREEEVGRWILWRNEGNQKRKEKVEWFAYFKRVRDW